MAKLMCAKCGGKVKMANGGTTPKKVLAKAFLFGVHVGLDIGVQKPLCFGFTAF